MRNGDDRLGNYHEWSLINVTIAYSLRSSILSFLRRLARATCLGLAGRLHGLSKIVVLNEYLF